MRDETLLKLKIPTMFVQVLKKFLCFLRRQVVIRARNLRTSAQFIPAKAFKARKSYYTTEVIPLESSEFTKPI